MRSDNLQMKMWTGPSRSVENEPRDVCFFMHDLCISFVFSMTTHALYVTRNGHIWSFCGLNKEGAVSNFLAFNSVTVTPLKGNSGIFKPGPYFWHEIRSSTHREQFGESRRPSEDI